MVADRLKLDAIPSMDTCSVVILKTISIWARMITTIGSQEARVTESTLLFDSSFINISPSVFAPGQWGVSFHVLFEFNQHLVHWVNPKPTQARIFQLEDQKDHARHRDDK